MNRKKVGIYGLSALLIAYQAGMGISVTAFAAPVEKISAVIQDKPEGIYQAKSQYGTWMKEYPNCVHGAEEWKKKDGKYQYPVTPYDKEWGTYLSKAERYVACQIPEEILAELTTEELLELVLDCPLLVDVFFSNSIKEGVKELAQNLNGVDELLSRVDCLAVVSKYYAEYKIPEKQQLDYDVLLGDSQSPDYYKIVNNENLMRKADADAQVMQTLNLCEAVMEIASEEDVMSAQEKRSVTQIIVEKSKEKAVSECVEGPSAELQEEDSLLNQCTKEFAAVSSRKAAKKDQTGSYKLGGKDVPYTIKGSSTTVSDAVINQALNSYKQYLLTSNGKQAVTVVRRTETTAYNCFNYAWLKKYDPKNLWKKCYINNDNAYQSYKYFSKRNSPSGVGWVGSDGKHAVYSIKAEVSYRDSYNNVKSEPLVISKWGPSGPLMQHPVSQCDNFKSNTPNLTWYC